MPRRRCHGATPAGGAAHHRLYLLDYVCVSRSIRAGTHLLDLSLHRFVRLDPGVALVLEANDRYWRKTPAIKQIIIKSVPDPATRLAMLKTGEADIAYDMLGDEGVAIKSDPQLRLASAMGSITELWSA
jgi:hypothetical protein